jgi:hypothetical protein
VRKRGFVFAIATEGAWAFDWRILVDIRRSPFVYELGSTAFPAPRSLEVSAWLALRLTVVALRFLVRDFVVGVKQKTA